jgi:uncharacterized protein
MLLTSMKIGVISDTHNHLDPKIPQLFAGVDHIIHGGDIGKAWVILQLEQIAPVTAVMGNSDEFLTFKETEMIELNERRFLVRHIVNPKYTNDDFQALLARQRPNVVVFGHTHTRFSQVIDGILYLNPGYAGEASRADRSVAILHWEEEGFRPQFLPL